MRGRIGRTTRRSLFLLVIIFLAGCLGLPRAAWVGAESGNISESNLNLQVQAAIVSNTGQGTGFSNAGLTSIMWTHTVSNGANRLLMVGVSTAATVLPAFPAARVSSVTYNAQPMTRVAPVGTQLSPDNRNAVEMFQLVAPPVGTADVVVNFVNDGLPIPNPVVNYAVGGSVSFTGVNQTTPTGAFTSNSNSDDAPTVTVTDGMMGDAVLDTVGSSPAAGFMVVGPNQTERWNGRPDFGAFDVGAGSTEFPATPITMSWALTNAQAWAIGAITVKAAPPTAATANIGGRVAGVNCAPLAGVTMTLLNVSNSQTRITTTGADGRYQFAAIQTGENYLITPACFGFTFNPSNQFFSHTGERTGLDFVGQPDAAQPRAVVNDFDGDGKSDLVVFRALNATWYIRHSSDNSTRAQQFGLATDMRVPADYDGDGKYDVAVFRPSNGYWYVLRSSDGALHAQAFGQEGDVPVTADYDGDAKSDFAVYRNGTWHILESATNVYRALQFGLSTDEPLARDYDGDGKADLAVYRGGAWHIKQSASGSVQTRQFGLSADRPVPCDYDGDAKSDVAVFREGMWYVIRSSNEAFSARPFGLSTDALVAGDYDGDGKCDIAVFRAGVWYIMLSLTNELRVEQWGAGSDVPPRVADAP